MQLPSAQFLGGAVIRKQDGIVTGSAAQRHRIALLAILVTARPTAIPRSKVMGYLWPDRRVHRARNLLNQSVHALRKTLGADVIRSTGHTLRINHELLGSDVVDFERALARNDLERGASIYTGPFLDGFYLPFAKEFEQWVDNQRRHFGRRYLQALEVLARRAEVRSDFDAALDWWGRLVGEDRYSSRPIVGMMRTLEATGRRGEALQVADEHLALLHEDLGAEADPDVATLQERIRQQPAGHSTGIARISIQTSCSRRAPRTGSIHGDSATASKPNRSARG